MKSSLFLLILISFSPIRAAENVPESYMEKKYRDEIIKQWNQKYAQASAAAQPNLDAIAAAQKLVDDLQPGVDELKEELKQLKAESSTSKDEKENEDAKLRLVRERISKADVELDLAKNKLTKAKLRQANDADDAKTYLNAAGSPEKVEPSVKKWVDDLVNIKVQQKLDSAYFEARHRIEDTRDRLEIIERQFDNLNAGRYVREKLQRLLTSDAMCETIKNADQQCAKPVAERKDPSLDNVFFNQKGKLGAPRNVPQFGVPTTH